MIEPSLDMMAGALFELIALARVDEYTEAGWRSETSSQHLKAQVDRSWLSKQLAQLDSAVHPPFRPTPKLLGGHFYSFLPFHVRGCPVSLAQRRSRFAKSKLWGAWRTSTDPMSFMERVSGYVVNVDCWWLLDFMVQRGSTWFNSIDATCCKLCDLSSHKLSLPTPPWYWLIGMESKLAK